MWRGEVFTISDCPVYLCFVFVKLLLIVFVHDVICYAVLLSFFYVML